MHQTFIRDPFCIFTEHYRATTTGDPVRVSDTIYAAHPFDQIEGLAVFFTGVVYNLEECAAMAESSSNDPREVLARLYRLKGDTLPTLLEGSYAIVIVSEDRIVAFRDRFGVENLYYSIDHENGSFILASSIAEIRKHMTLRVHQRILPKFFLFQQLNGSETFFEGISAVALRELLSYTVLTRSWTSVRYDDLPYRPMNRNAGDDQTIIAKTEDRLRSIIERFHDIFHGFTWTNSYSGGTDSALQAVLLKELGHLTAHTTCHAHAHGDDVAYYAQSVAEVLDLDHHTVRVEPHDLLGCIERAVIAAEVPFVFEGECLLEGMHQAIADEVPPGPDGTLVVNGHGSDALFAHGRQLVEFAQLSRTGFPFLLSIANMLLAPGLTPSRYQRYRAIGNALWTGNFDEQGLQTLLCNPKSIEIVSRAFHFDRPPSIFGHELDEMERYRVSPLEQMYRLWIFEHETTRANNVNYQAAKAKNLLMVFPFRDLELVDFIVSIPTERKLQRFTSKYYVKQILSQYLPASLVHRRKILQHRDEGFLSILKSDPRFEAVVEEIRNACYPYFDFDVDEVFGNPDYENIGVFLINFHLWHRHFIGVLPAGDTATVRERSAKDQTIPPIAMENLAHKGGVAADGM